MASGFPGSIDNFTDPLTTSALNSPSHAGQHQDLNDAVEKIETYMGLVKVIPTSVSSAGGTAATLAANGTITIGTSNTSVTVGGCFSALYDNYRVIVSGGAGSTSADLGFQLSGITTGYYSFLYYSAYNANTVSGLGESNTASWGRAGAITSNSIFANFEICNPFATKVKHYNAAHGFSVTTVGFYIAGGWVNSTSSATGFVLTPYSGTLTGGSIRVYGYRN